MSEPADPSDDWKKFYENPPPVASTPESPSGSGAPKESRWFKPWVIIGGIVVLIAFACTRALTIDRGGVNQPSAADPRKVMVTAPATLGDRPKSTDGQLVGPGQDMEAKLKAIPGTTSTALAFYGSQSKQNLLMIVAVTSVTGNMEKRLGMEFASLASQPGTQVVTVAETVEAGPLGGVARCGELKIQGVQAAFCGWADDQSLGLVVWYLTGLATAKSEFETVRSQIEQVA